MLKFEPLPVAYLNTDNTGKIKKELLLGPETSGQNSLSITYTVMGKLLNLLIPESDRLPEKLHYELYGENVIVQNIALLRKNYSH